MSDRRRSKKDEHTTIGFRRRQERHARTEKAMEGNPLGIGIDLASEKHAVWIADKALIPIERFMTVHSREGIDKLLARAEAIRAKRGFGSLIVFMEPTGHLWLNVANDLEKRGVAYHTVAPIAVKWEREIEHLTYAKGDYRDAELIHRLGMKGQWMQRVLDGDSVWLRLDVLAREHELVLEAETAERNRIRSFLGLVLPEFCTYFRKPLGKTARATLRHLANPSSDVPKTYASLVERLAGVTGQRLYRHKIAALAQHLAGQPSFGVERFLAPVLSRVGLSLDRFDLLVHQRNDLRKRLVALYEEIPYKPFLDTVPGVTPENHALVLALIGDPKRCDRASCLVKLSGMEPRENHSGMGAGSHSISRRGRPRLRHVLYRVVMGLKLANPEFAAYVKRLKTREKNPLKRTQADVAAANKYLRLVYRLCVDGVAYDPSKAKTEDS